MGNIAEIANMPIKNNFIPKPTEKTAKSEVASILPLSHVNPTTNIIPNMANKIPFPTSLQLYFSSFTINGTAPAINPINKELTT